MEKINFKINGFHCGACVKLATMKLKKITGVDSVVVLPDGQVTIEACHAIAQGDIEHALEGTEYTVDLN